MSNTDQQGSSLGSFPTSPPLYSHFNRPSGFWPCVKSCLVGGSDKYRILLRYWSKCFKEFGWMEFGKNTQELALDLNTSQSTICCHFKKEKFRKLSDCVVHILSESSKGLVWFGFMSYQPSTRFFMPNPVDSYLLNILNMICKHKSTKLNS